MSNKEIGPRLIFRNKRINSSGEEIIEERELVGCTTSEIMNYLSAPWESSEVEPSDPVSSVSRVEQFTDALNNKLQQIQMYIEESQTKKGESRFVIGFREEKERETKEEHSDRSIINTQVPLAGDLKMQLQGDFDDADISMVENNNRIDVNNRALLVVNRDNIYAIVNLNLKLIIQQHELIK